MFLAMTLSGAYISGTHVNPAVTAGLYFRKGVSTFFPFSIRLFPFPPPTRPPTSFNRVTRARPWGTVSRSSWVP